MTLLALSLGAVALLLTVVPLLRTEEEAPPLVEGSHGRAPLDARRKMIYEGIRDLDFEHSMGKLEESDYQELRSGMVSEAALVLEEMEATGPDDALDRWIEAEVRDRRGAKGRAGSAARELLVGPLLAGRDHEEATGRLCAACGRENLVDARFCDGCGGKLAVPSCSACQTAQRANATFCAQCGAKL